MEVQLQSLATLASIFLSIFIVFKLLTKSKSQGGGGGRLPPGPPKLPIIGNMHNVMSPLPHRTFHELAQKYGPVMHLQLGDLSLVVISSPESAKELMKTHDLNFATKPTSLASDILTYNSKSSGSAPYGDYWRFLRKIYTTELLGAKRVQSFRSIREEVFSDLVRWAAENEGRPVNLTVKIYSAICGVVLRAAVGQENKNKEKLLEIVRKAFELSAGFGLTDVFSSMKWLQRFSTKRPKLMRMQREVDSILEDILRQHKAAKSLGAGAGDKEKHEDLLDVLLKFQDEVLEFPLEDENIKAILMEVIAGGSDTSVTNTNWAMAQMIRNPEILRKAQEEVRRVFDGKKGRVDESYLQECKYLKAVAKETLRYHTPMLAPRLCGETVEIDGYTIPKGTTVLVNVRSVSRDPKYWDEPDVFRPERFLDSAVDFVGSHYEFIPFGAGRRMCPGLTFGMANLELPLAMLLYHFDWKLPDGVKNEDLDMTEKFSITCSRKKDLIVIPVVKRPLITC